MTTLTERQGQMEWEATCDTAEEALKALWSMRNGGLPVQSQPVVAKEIPDFALKACADSMVSADSLSGISVLGMVFPADPTFVQEAVNELRGRIFNHLKAAFGPREEAKNA